MDYLFTVFMEYLPRIVQSLGWGVVLWGWWSLKRIFVRHEDLKLYRKEVIDKFTRVDTRLTEIETVQQDRTAAQEQLRQKLDLLPTAKDMQALAISMKEMEGDIKGMNSKMDGLSHATNRLERAVDMFTEASMERAR